jgi:8-oxo-dGTP pyrophosphatase MutT (NUDIX family)
LNQYSWEVPEGGGKKNVSPLESAQRELLEETGLIAKRWTMIQKLHLSNSATDEEAYIFIAQDLTEGQAEPEETEALQLRKLPFEEVYQMVLRQEITDALSVAAILRTKITL